jgi:hypothetical protein
VSIEPQLNFSCSGNIGSAPALNFFLYPLGNKPGSPDFRLDILPNFQFYCEGGTTTQCLLELARRILVPLGVETLIDNNEVRGWLNTPLFGTSVAVSPGVMLDAATILQISGSGPNATYNLRPLSEFSDPKRFVARLLGSSLRAFFNALANGATPLVPFEGGGLYLTSKPATPSGTLYGIRLAIPDIEISDDPEISIEMAGETDWIQRASNNAPANLRGGIALKAAIH